MAEATAAAWSPRQRQLLQAMGYPLWRLRRPANDSAAASAASSGPEYRLLARQAGSARSIACVLAGPPPEDGSPAHRLLLNLLRSAGLSADPASAATSPAATLELPPLPQLLRQPDAKRSLWPVLRALRRAGGCGPGA